MKKSTFVLGMLFSMAFFANAQPYQFTRPYGTVQTDINQGYKIIPTQDGNYVIAGTWNNQGYLMKVNCKGDSIDRKTYAGTVGGNYRITDVLELANGDLLVGGQCDHCVAGDTTGKVLLFETDAALNYKPAPGLKKFLPPVSGPLMTTGEATPETKLARSGDGFYVLSITHCLSDLNPTFGCWNTEDSYVTKLDNALNIQWHKLLDFENGFIFHYEKDPQLRYTPSGLYVSRWGNNIFGTNPDSSVVQKIDLNGNPLVSKTFNGIIRSTALNPAGTVLTCVGEIGYNAWLVHLNANTLTVLASTLLVDTFRTQAATVQYTPDGHLLVGMRHWRLFSVQSRLQRMQGDFAVVSVDTIPNPDAITNMSVTSVWPTNADGSRFVSCGIRGLYNRTFFHALSDCAPFVLTLANVSPVTCHGSSNGSVTLSVSNGYGPFQYRRDNGTWGSSAILNGLAPGSYIFQARDNNGNILSLPATITQAPTLLATATVALNVITIVANGGAPPYTYRLGITGGYQASPVFDSLANGAYLVTVLDANGCSVVTTALISVPALQSSATVTGQILCFGNTGGQITVTAGGGVPPYWYSLNNGPLQSGNVFSGLGAGSYTIVVKDSQGNTKTNTVVLTSPSALTATTTVSLNVITALANGGTPPYTYRLGSTGSYQTSPVFASLANGTYLLTILDANGCSTSTTALISVSALQSSATVTGQILCFGNTSGQITVTAGGGVPPYWFSLNNSPLQNSNVFSGLGAGIYTIVVTDAQGNTKTNTVTLTSPPALTATATVNLNVITAAANGGTPPYAYRLGSTGGYQTSPVFDSLANGSYLLTVLDANGCSTSTTALVSVAALQSSASVTGQILCFGNPSGQITVTATAGLPPYWYSLNNGPLQSGNVFSGLGAGSYMIVVTDAQGNTRMNMVTLTSPPALSVSVVANQSSIIVTAAGGTGAWQYSLDGQNFQTGNVFAGLTDGAYTVTVKDVNGCTATSQSVVVATLPTAAFTANVQSGCGPLTVQFNSTSSANATALSWKFPGGNPATSTVENPIVTYGVAGTYPVILTASNTAGSDTASQTNFITVLPFPEAGFISEADGNTFSFANTSANAMAYAWNFGDGQSSTETNPVHTFAGSPCLERFITLVAANNCGIDTATLFIPHADPVPPTAAFTYSAMDLTVTFSSTSLFAATFQWEFGDDSTSTEANPVHTYAQPGSYLVKLTVKEFCGFFSGAVSQSLVLTTPTRELAWLQGLRLFPNPATDAFTVEMDGEAADEVGLSLFSPHGQEVYGTISGFRSGHLTQRFEVSDLPTGLYLLRIRAGEKSTFLKVLVQR